MLNGDLRFKSGLVYEMKIKPNKHTETELFIDNIKKISQTYEVHNFIIEYFDGKQMPSVIRSFALSEFFTQAQVKKLMKI